MSTTIAYLGLVIALVGTLVRGAFAYTEMPAKMASHFNGDGVPNDWMDKSQFFLVFLGIQFGIVALMLGIAFLVRWLPDSMINVPHKTYWLAPERRTQTMQQLHQVLLWCSTATCLFLAGVFELTLQANLPGGKFSMLGMWIGLGVYFVFLFGVCARYYVPLLMNAEVDAHPDAST